jgi:hypothetical protein
VWPSKASKGKELKKGKTRSLPDDEMKPER